MALKVYGGELILSGTQVIAVTGALEAYHEIAGSGKGIQISDGGAIAAGSDIYFHVSGSTIANDEGVAVFGGDLVVSGTLYDGDGSAISLTLANDANNRVTTGVGDGTINAEANLTFDGSTLTVTGDATITDDLTLNSDSAVFNMGAGNDFKITHDGTTGATIAGNPLTLDSAGDITLDAGGGDIFFEDDGTEVGSLQLTGTTNMTLSSKGYLTLNTDNDVIFFKDGTQSSYYEAGSLHLTGTTNMTLSSKGDLSLDANGSDIFFKDSGTEVGSLQLTGTTNMTLKANGLLSLASNNDAVAFRGADDVGDPGHAASGKYFTIEWGDTATSDDTVLSSSITDTVIILKTSVSGSSKEYIRSGKEQVLILSGWSSGPTSPDPKEFTDTNFYVSGTIGGKDSDARGTMGGGVAVFGGDVVVSGTLYDSDGSAISLTLANDANNRIVTAVGDGTINGEANLTFDGSTLTVTGDAVVTDDLTLNSDAAVFNMGAGNDFTITHDGTTGVEIHGTPIEITSTGELHLSASTNLVLESDSGMIQLKDRGSSFGTIENSSSDIIISASVANKDIIFQGQSTGATTEIARFDTSATALLMASTNKLQFTDSGMFIHGASDGDLLISSDGTADDSLKLQASSGAGGGGGIFLTGSVMQVTGTKVQLVSTHKALILSGSGENEGYGDTIQVSGTLTYGGHSGGAQLGGQQNASQYLSLAAAQTNTVADLTALSWDEEVAHVQVSYCLDRDFSGAATRVEGGRLYITMDMTGSNVSAVSNNQGGDIGVTWTMQSNAGTSSSLQYSTTAGAAVHMRYMVERIFEF